MIKPNNEKLIFSIVIFIAQKVLVRKLMDILSDIDTILSP